MKIVATGYGDPAKLKTVNEDPGIPGRGEVAVRVRAAAVNPLDTKRYTDPDYVQRHAGPAPSFPIGLGVEAAGVVTAVGDHAKGPAGPTTRSSEASCSDAFDAARAYTPPVAVPRPLAGPVVAYPQLSAAGDWRSQQGDGDTSGRAH